VSTNAKNCLVIEISETRIKIILNTKEEVTNGSGRTNLILSIEKTNKQAQ
jgi:hypothetical protein